MKGIDATEIMRSRVILSFFCCCRFPICTFGLSNTFNQRQRTMTSSNGVRLFLLFKWLIHSIVLIQYHNFLCVRMLIFVFACCLWLNKSCYVHLVSAIWAGTTFTCGFKLSKAILVANVWKIASFLWHSLPANSRETRILWNLMTKLTKLNPTTALNFLLRMFLWFMSAMPASCCF